MPKLSMASGSELAIIQTAATALSAVARATRAVIETIRLTGVAGKYERQVLQDKLAYLRRQEISGYIQKLGLLNMGLVKELFDEAERNASNARAYEESLVIARRTVVLLDENLRQLGHDLGARS